MATRILQSSIFNVFAFVIALATHANTIAAQEVRIQNGLGEWGFGWMFRFENSCHIALPAHVAGPLPKITVATAAPMATDQATVRLPFWPDLDLAVAIVDPGPLDGRCTATLADLKQSTRSRNATQAVLSRVLPLGDEERLPLQILDRNYLTFIGQVADSDDAIAQGTSGAFAFVGSTPIGMAITSDDPTRATFLRAEEIAMNIERYLNEQGVAFRSSPQEPAANGDTSQGFALTEISTNSLPVLPQFSPENLTGQGLYVTRPDAQVEITLRLEGKSPVGVGRLRITAPGGDYAVPRDIAIFLDPSTTGDRFRFWTQGRMTPDGQFDTGRLAPRNARLVRILLRDAWSAGDIALDRVSVE
ncbi:hypothetical protein ILP92_11410 [Maribius pontilimi]|uniref:Uncharacterized protein n=1 Tax=Palleronia pontilimi TaxID=1964209 RepID=A0A934MD02_9RHOB|nr:hypothetical protein [Palleronia pontilimi]MBJ3763353.1 hypothetical protein [Palleronia pontilimi]